MKKYPWPGNVRELKNFVERAVIFTEEDTVSLAVVPEQYRLQVALPDSMDDLRDSFSDAARATILKALKESRGKKLEAAKRLEISRKTLYNRMKKLSLE